MSDQKYTIATLGSHSALQILHGAKSENFSTLLITTPDREIFYKRFPSFIDEVKTISSFADFPKIENELKDKNVIVIPHGSFVAYLGVEKNKAMTLPYFGNKAVLDWEQDRQKQYQWLTDAKINTPPQYKSIDEAEFPVIVKSYGAAGGAGYFIAKDRADFEEKKKSMTGEFIIQKYIVGVTLYIHYFYSSLTNTVEILSMDRRYETNADAIGRIPAHIQDMTPIDPSYVVVGNSPLVLRESMLPEAYDMGERLVTSSKKLINEKGLFGPFCLETIITPDMKFYAIEVSARIVAGTNLFTDSSPYAVFHHDKSISTGERIAMEIKRAIKDNKLTQVLD